MVGDSAPAIYGWRGARDVMSTFNATALTLSRSFRFGAAVATEANRWLAIAGQPLRITGTPDITSTVTTPTGIPPAAAAAIQPRAILCRTNGGVMTEILAQLGDRRRVALVGDGKPLQDLALAARDLKHGRRATHPELMLFSTWGEVQDYAQYDPTGRDLQPLVDVIDEHGIDLILATLDQLSPRPTPTPPSPPSTKPKAANGPPSASPTTSPSRRTPTAPTATATRYPARSTPPRPAWPTSRSPALNTTSTSAGSAGSTAIPTETPPQHETRPTPSRSKTVLPAPPPARSTRRTVTP